MQISRESAPAAPIDRRLRYQSVFCSFVWPKHPGHSGGEIRDFHLLRRLLSISRVEFFALYEPPGDGRTDSLRPYLEALQTPAALIKTHPECVQKEALNLNALSRLADTLRARHFPVPGFL